MIRVIKLATFRGDKADSKARHLADKLNKLGHSWCTFDWQYTRDPTNPCGWLEVWLQVKEGRLIVHPALPEIRAFVKGFVAAVGDGF